MERGRTVEPITEPNFIATLGLNWKLFLAQLVNFGIVVFILWKWVFRPVVSALESRRKKIEDSVKHAEEIEKRMQESQSERENLIVQARKEAEDIGKKAQTAAESTKKEIMEHAKAESERILNQTKAAVAAEKDQMLKEVREEIATLVVGASEKIIREKLDEKKDKELISGALWGLK